MGVSKRLWQITSISLTVAACAPMGKPAREIAQKSLLELGCKTSQSAMWSSFHKVIEESEIYPPPEELRAALKKEGEARGYGGEAFTRYVDAFIENYQTVVVGIDDRFAPEDASRWKKALAEMEVGVRVTSVHADLADQINATLAKLAAAEAAINADCSAPPPAPTPTSPAPAPGTIWEQLAKAQSPEVTGILKTFATAYQSCDVLSLAPMTAETPSVQGITVVGEHPAGGLKREISNVAAVNSSHYYINGQRLAKTSCFEIRNSPLIYDFGGKPYTSSADPYLLDMFKNGGSGTSVLGIDCSGFVFSAIGLAGLKLDYDPKKVMKADLVHGIPSTAFKEPQSNGMRCFDKTTMTKQTSILPGDIVAISGHVNIVDAVGADPFGLARAQSSSDCTAAKLSYTGFDFVLAQSSPSKGGIGINRYQAKNYLAESSTYRDGLTAYAVAACKAKFGGSGAVALSTLSVVRHRKTADCRAPKPLVTRFEDCVDSCRAL